MSIAFWTGLVVAILVLWLTGLFSEAWTGLRDARLAGLLLVLLLGMALPITHALRWMVVVKSLDAPVRPLQAADITVSAALLNYASPGFVGASAKALLANRSARIPLRTSALSIAFEHSLDLSVMVITSALAILILGPSSFRGAVAPLEEQISLVVVLIGIIVMGIAAGIAIKLGVITHVIALIHTVRTLGRNVDARLVALLTFIYWLLQVLVVWVLLWSLGAMVSPIDVLALSTVPTLAGMLAPVPGGVGVREAVIVALTTVTGIGTGTLLTLAIVQRVLLVAALPMALGVLRGFRLVAVTRL